MSEERWDRERIQQKLRQDAAWRRRTVQMLYEEQSIAERSTRETLHENGVGFTGPDARGMSFAVEIMRKRGELPRGAEIMLAKRLPKYWRQVLRAIEKRNIGRVIKSTQSYVILKENKE